MGNTILDRTGAPSYTWLLCLAYGCFILNFTVSSTLNGGVPIQRATGSSTNDISPLLRFQFWEPVYYKLDDSTFPSESREKLGRFICIAKNVGHFMTFKILTDDTKKIIFCSNVWIEDNPTSRIIFFSINDDESEEIITYNEILNHIENDETEETTVWKFK
jgi:hypothetical protein